MKRERDLQAIKVFHHMLEAIVIACAAFIARWFIREFSKPTHAGHVDYEAQRVPPRPLAGGEVNLNVQHHEQVADPARVAAEIQFHRRMRP